MSRADEKLVAFLSVKMTDGEKASMVECARKAGLTISEYVRSLHRAASMSAVPVDVRPLKIYTLDDIGPDPLWSGAGALRA